MKKIFLLTLFCLIYQINFGQKSFSSKNFIVETVDEFGDNTGKMKVGTMAKGYFSNSATSNSCAQLIINLMEDYCWIDLCEYCSGHSSDESFNVTCIGITTKKELSFASYDFDENHRIFLKLCKENDTIHIKLRASRHYSSTNAVFKLYNCKDLYQKYIKEFPLFKNQALKKDPILKKDSIAQINTNLNKDSIQYIDSIKSIKTGYSEKHPINNDSLFITSYAKVNQKITIYNLGEDTLKKHIIITKLDSKIIYKKYCTTYNYLTFSLPEVGEYEIIINKNNRIYNYKITIL